MVWTSLLLIVLLFGGLFGLSLYKYITLKDLPDSQGNIFQINFTSDYFVDFINQVLAISILNHGNNSSNVDKMYMVTQVVVDIHTGV